MGKFGHRHAHIDNTCKEEGGDQGDAYTSLEMSYFHKPPQLGERHGTDSEGTNPVHTWSQTSLRD